MINSQGGYLSKGGQLNGSTTGGGGHQLNLLAQHNSSANPKRHNSQAPKDPKNLTQPINLAQLMNNLQTTQTNPEYESQRYAAPTSYQNQQQAQRVGGGGGGHGHVQQNAHSLGRDLQGMGLITQVKKGEKMPTVIPMAPQYSLKKQSTNEIDQGGRNSQNQLNYESSSMQEQAPLLKPQRPEFRGRKTLVLDLDETLVHSSFKAPTAREPPADIVLPVDIEGRICHVYVLVRPGCLKFLNEMAKYYEVVIFTASLSKYADPLMDIIDQKGIAPQRLFREHCTFHEQSGVFVKDMTRLGRPMTDVFIIDNSPLSYAFQPENGMPILSWYDDRTDTKLIELIPVLKLLSEVPDVRPVLLGCCTRDNVYLPDKSIVMCTRIIDEQTRRKEKQKQILSHNQTQPTGSNMGSNHIEDQGTGTSTQHASKAMHPQINTWVLGPPQKVHNTDEEDRQSSSNISQNTLQQQAYPIATTMTNANQRGKRNAIEQNLPQSQLNFQKPQYLTQTNSKQNLLNTSQGNSNSTYGAPITLTPSKKTNKTINQEEEKSLKSLTNQTMLSGTQDEGSSLNLGKKHSSLSKKRPKTANRDPSAPKTQAPPSRTKADRSPLKVSIGDSAFKKTVSQLMSPQFMSPKQQSPLISQTPISNSQRTRPSYHTQKSANAGFTQNSGSIDKKQNSASKPKGSVSGRPMTTQNSTRNSSERMTGLNIPSTLNSSSALSKTRAASARKKPTTFSERDLLMIGNQQTPLASKNISKLAQTQGPTFICQSQNNKQLRGGSSSQKPPIHQNLTSDSTPQSVKMSNGGSLLNRMIQSGITTPQMSYSSSKKSTKPSTASKPKRMPSTSPGAELRDASFIGGKSPGKIFATANQTLVSHVGGNTQMILTQSQQAYVNLMKNMSPTFKVSQTPQGVKNSTPKTSTGVNQSNSSIKAMKLAPQHSFSGVTGGGLGTSGYLSQKLSQTLQSLGQLGYAPSGTNVSNGGSSQALDAAVNNSSDTQISSMLNEFERTKNINKELLLMRNIGSPKQPLSHK